MSEYVLSILLHCWHKDILKYHLRGKLHADLIYIHLSKAQLKPENTTEAGTQTTLNKKDNLAPSYLQIQ